MMSERRRCSVLCAGLALFVTSQTAAHDVTVETRVLEQHSWSLMDARSAKGSVRQVYMPPNSDPMTLHFKNGGLEVSGCNDFGTGYALGDGRLASPEEKLATQTLLGCPAARGAADDATFALLTGNPRYQLIPASHEHAQPRLLIESTEATLAFRGAPTLETRFLQQR